MFTCSCLAFLSVQYKASKEGTVVGVTISKVAMLTHCQALTQACNYCEGEWCCSVAITWRVLHQCSECHLCLSFSFLRGNFSKCAGLQKRYGLMAWSSDRKYF